MMRTEKPIIWQDMVGFNHETAWYDMACVLLHAADLCGMGGQAGEVSGSLINQ